MSFVWPEDAARWGGEHCVMEYNGETIRQFIYLDPESRLGRLFWTGDDRRIFLVGPRNGAPWPFTIQVDGEPVKRRAAFVLYALFAEAVDHMHKIDGIHAGLEDSDGDE